MSVLVNAGTTISIPSDGITLTDTGMIAGVLNGAGTIDGPFLLQIQSTGALIASAGPVSINTGQVSNQGTIDGGGSTDGVTIAQSVSLTNLSGGVLTGGTWEGDIAFLNGTIDTDSATIDATGTMTEQGASGVQPIQNTLSSITPTGSLLLETQGWSLPGSLVDSGNLALTTFLDAGALTVGSGGTLFADGSITTLNGLTIEAGGTMLGDTSVSGPMTVNGTVNPLSFIAREVSVSGVVGGTGVINDPILSPGATLLAGLTTSGAVVTPGDTGGTILLEGLLDGLDILGAGSAAVMAVVEISNSFSNAITLGGASEVVLQSPGSFTGTMNDFDNQSTIVLDGIVANSVSSNFIASNPGLVTLLNNGSVVYSLALDPEHIDEQVFPGGKLAGPAGTLITGQDYSFALFTATPDALNNNTTITVSGINDINEFIPTPQCFASGTRIASRGGEVPIERLRPGDRVFAHFGGERRVVWTGHRVFDRSGSADEAVPVVRIAAGAFGPGRPKRDLLVSPDHAVFVENVLIPARYLINGTTIREVAMDIVTFWHVELDAHDVVLAEGLPMESFLDNGDRSFFNSYDGGKPLSAWRGGLAWETVACAPLVVTGPILAAARAKVREMVLT